LNLDTGNSYIAGQDPVEFARRFGKKVKHMHIKDVTEQLSATNRGEDTGIPISHSAIGDGVNAANIKECLKIVHEAGFNGAISMEVEGNGGPTIEKSLRWLRKTLAGLRIPEERSTNATWGCPAFRG
jgi:sugar phosphate isomerase/epimerase